MNAKKLTQREPATDSKMLSPEGLSDRLDMPQGWIYAKTRPPISDASITWRRQ